MAGRSLCSLFVQASKSDFPATCRSNILRELSSSSLQPKIQKRDFLTTKSRWSAVAADERQSLVDRQLPEMKLCDGSAGAITAPIALKKVLSAEQRAAKRFEVQGNAAISGGTGTLAMEGARALLEHGLSGLALFDVHVSPQASDAVDALRSDFPSANIVVKTVNVTDASGVNTAMTEVAEELGGVDIMACFAGVVGCTHAIDMSPEEWRKTIDINTTGEFLCAQAAARHMKGRGGSIVLIASISGHRVNYPQPQVAYNVSKSALHHMARCLAAEWADMGVRVNTISPGYMDTILNEGDGIAKARKVWADHNPMGRMGAPQELTGPLVMLCSRFAGGYITGADIVVDGGQCAF